MHMDGRERQREEEAARDTETLDRVLWLHIRHLDDLGKADEALRRHPSPEAVFERARLNKESGESQRIVEAMDRHPKDRPERPLAKVLEERRRATIEQAKKSSTKSPERPSRLVGYRHPMRFFDPDNRIMEPIDRRSRERADDAVGQAVTKYLSDREYQAHGAWEYAAEPTIENEDYYRMVAAASEKSREVLVEKSKGLPKDVVDSLWSGIRTLEQDVDRRIAREHGHAEQDHVPQLGDPGYAEWRDQQRGKDRGGRER
jgi:hypothetical protein